MSPNPAPCLVLIDRDLVQSDASWSDSATSGAAASTNFSFESRRSSWVHGPNSVVATFLM
jgi:hypothetical protein